MNEKEMRLYIRFDNIDDVKQVLHDLDDCTETLYWGFSMERPLDDDGHSLRRMSNRLNKYGKTWLVITNGRLFYATKENFREQDEEIVYQKNKSYLNHRLFEGIIK